MSAIDPVTLAVLKGRLEQIADEMDATLYRSALNPIIAEARDACHGLYHPVTGATLVQGTNGLPIFVGAMAFAVKAVIDKVVAKHDKRVQACGTKKKAAEAYPVFVHLEIEGNGQVSQAKPAKHNKEAMCVAGVAKKLHFPATGTQSTIEFPFMMTPK